jgi:hypothetical protein
MALLSQSSSLGFADVIEQCTGGGFVPIQGLLSGLPCPGRQRAERQRSWIICVSMVTMTRSQDFRHFGSNLFQFIRPDNSQPI